MICRSMKNKFTYIWLSMSDGSWGWKKYLIHGDFGGDEVEEVEIMGMKKLGFEKREKPNKTTTSIFYFCYYFIWNKIFREKERVQKCIKLMCKS